MTMLNLKGIKTKATNMFSALKKETDLSCINVESMAGQYEDDVYDIYYEHNKVILNLVFHKRKNYILFALVHVELFDEDPEISTVSLKVLDKDRLNYLHNLCILLLDKQSIA